MTNARATERLTEISDLDFFIGLLCALRLRGYESFAWRVGRVRLFRAVHAAYQKLEELVDDYKLELHFRVQPDAVFGDSQTVGACISHCLMSRMLSYDAPYFEYLHLRLRPADAEHWLTGQRYDGSRKILPGNRDLYEQLAQAFLDAYR